MILSHQKFDLKDKHFIEKVKIKAPFRFSVNFPNEACFIYFEGGTTKINSALEQISVNPKESVLLKCGNYFSDLKECSGVDHYEILVIHLYPEILRAIYENEIPKFLSPPENNQFIKKVSSNQVIRKYVEGLYFYFDNPSLVNNDLLQLKLKELIILLIQTEHANSIENLFTDLFTPYEAGIKEIVNKHLFTDLTIGDMAILSKLSISTFKRKFQEIFKTTPAKYIRKQRLDKAIELLTISSHTISEIAFQTCFKDTAHFSRTFKEAFGKTPSAYRLTVNTDDF